MALLYLVKTVSVARDSFTIKVSRVEDNILLDHCINASVDTLDSLISSCSNSMRVLSQVKHLGGRFQGDPCCALSNVPPSPAS